MRYKIQVLALKLVISLSFLLIFGGIYLTIEQKINYVHPSPDEVVKIPNQETTAEESIAITTTEEPLPPEETTSDELPPTVSTPTTEDYIQQNEVKQQPTTIETINDQLRKQMENTYGINIKYGNEISSYTVSNLSISNQIDPNIINTALNTIKQELTLYPQGFIKETTDIGLSLDLYIIKRFSQDYVTGITDSRNSNIKISLTTDYSIKDTIHHEMFHYIENYLLNVGGVYTSWDSLNPNTFKYGHEDRSLSCNQNNPNSAIFINNYAQTNAYEDRASTFEFMMYDNKNACFTETNTIGIKANYIAKQLEQFFDSVSPNVTEHWERFI